MSNIGLARGTVKLVPHDDKWHEIYLAEAKLLQDKVGLESQTVQHVGSTSIPGILAKPIIDIAILVDSIDKADEWSKALAGLGYWDKGPQPDMPDRRFFAKGPEEQRTVYLHLVNEREFTKLIKFRDTLTNDKELAVKYSELKQRLALSHANDRTLYTQLKNDFIQDVLAQ